MPFMILQQLIRYAIVGLVSNGLLYLLYLGLTAIGVVPKVAMTIAYVIGTGQTFYVNRAWSFNSSVGGSAFLYYATVYAAAYEVQWISMWKFIDQLGYPHQLVVFVQTFVVAGLIFLALRAWVFRDVRGPRPLPRSN
jgi:putative flippase GtrA